MEAAAQCRLDRFGQQVGRVALQGLLQGTVVCQRLQELAPPDAAGVAGALDNRTQRHAAPFLCLQGAEYAFVADQADLERHAPFGHGQFAYQAVVREIQRVDRTPCFVQDFAGRYRHIGERRCQRTVGTVRQVGEKGVGGSRRVRWQLGIHAQREVAITMDGA